MSRLRTRHAFTLLEVILALAILVGSLAVVSKLVELSARSSLYARYHARAIELAGSKMEEIVTGAVPLDIVGAQPFEEDPDFQWQLDIAEGPLPGLKLVRVRVSPAPSGRLARLREPVEFELIRYVLDPDYLASVTETSDSVGDDEGSERDSQ